MYTGGRRRHTAAEADLLRQEAMEWQTMELIDDIDGHCLMTGTPLREDDILVLPPLASSPVKQRRVTLVHTAFGSVVAERVTLVHTAREVKPQKIHMNIISTNDKLLNYPFTEHRDVCKKSPLYGNVMFDSWSLMDVHLVYSDDCLSPCLVTSLLYQMKTTHLSVASVPTKYYPL